MLESKSMRNRYGMNSNDRDKENYLNMLNSYESRVDFITLSKVASKNKLFVDKPIDTHRSENVPKMTNEKSRLDCQSKNRVRDITVSGLLGSGESESIVPDVLSGINTKRDHFED